MAYVSIHIQLLSWKKVQTNPEENLGQYNFNPHPAFKLDESRSKHQIGLPQRHCFNPHPTVELDEKQTLRFTSLVADRFNPHPIVKLDERQQLGHWAIITSISIHIQQLSWMKGIPVA